MGDTKKIFCQISFYDQPAIQELLEDMAQRGWMIKQPGTFFWTFRRMEPKKLKFAVTYFPNASEFDPGPSQGELTKLDFCAQDGWQLAVKWGAMQIFYNEDENAVPIETDPVAQVENVHRAMRKNTLKAQFFSIALVVYWLGFQCWQLLRDPAEYLSDPMMIYQLPLWLCFLLTSLYELWVYFSWTRKAKRVAEEDGVFLPVRSRPIVNYLLSGVSILFLLLTFGASGTSFTFILVWGAVMFIIGFAADRVKRWLKKKGAPRTVNFAVSMGTTLVLTILFMCALVAAAISGNFSFQKKTEPVDTYEYHGREFEIYDDPLPLVIEDMMQIEGNWSKEMDAQQTGLVSYTEYDQQHLWNETRRIPNLNYTVIDVKVPFLYDFIKQSILDSYQDKVFEDFVHIDHYEPVDPTPWNARAVYQHHFSNSVLDKYLVCWDGRIVVIHFYWEPTLEQIKIAAEKLAPS